MKIGDEVYIHGYIDEIRNDVVIIRNEGGYFGTVPSEVNSSEKPNNCTDCECADDCSECKEAEHGCKDEPTRSKMEQVDKDTNVRSKYDCKTCKHDLWHTPRMCGKCIRQEDGKPSMYEPKTEPQTERSSE